MAKGGKEGSGARRGLSKEQHFASPNVNVKGNQDARRRDQGTGPRKWAIIKRVWTEITSNQHIQHRIPSALKIASCCTISKNDRLSIIDAEE